MSFNTKNYQESCDKLVIGGTLELKESANLVGFPKSENQADSTATTVDDLKTDLNSLITKLKAAGLMEADSE